MRSSKTRVTRRPVPYKWRKICRNSLLTIYNYDLKNVGEGRRAVLSQWFHSLQTYKSIKDIFDIIAPTLAAFNILAFEILDLEK